MQTYALDLAASPTFFFWLFEGGPSRQGSDPHQLSSGYFNVTDKSASSSPVSVSAAESASTTAAAAPSPSPAESALGDPLSVGARAGLGAAVSVFCLAVAALVFLFFWRRARKRARKDGGGGGGPATDYTESVAELQSECVSLGAPGKLPCRVYQPVPGDASGRPPALAELPA